MPPPSSSPYFRGNKPSNGQFMSPRNKPVKRNTSILNFFKKSETPPKPTQHRITDYVVRSGGNLKNKPHRNVDKGSVDTSGGLFFDEDESNHRGEPTNGNDARGNTPDSFSVGVEDIISSRIEQDKRYNEIGGSVKRRRTNVEVTMAESVKIQGIPLDNSISQVSDISACETDPLASSQTRVNGKIRRNGPFVDESDSEEDLSTFRNEGSLTPPLAAEISTAEHGKDNEPHNKTVNRGMSSPIGFQDDYRAPDLDDVYHGLDNPSENEEDGYQSDDVFYNEDNSVLTNEHESVSNDVGSLSDNEVAVCPICQIGLGGLTDGEASLHVNDCLDGNPNTGSKNIVTESKSNVTSLSRAERKAIARPGQKNPFTIGSKSSNTSAFSKLMSSNAEDTAWAVAAESEVASRGKQSYERTCPFYKILPGFSICVDAFRYGAVEGCTAYFLSHFHSDHYVGLTSSWRHGPIYCSRVTGNLVRQQLKVNPEMIVDIEFEKPTDVPGTDGVRVTMIPANHCPGSSLFLFEKTVGKGKNPRVQRILHCGDFRASPVHAKHPLLRPDALDQVTGEPKQQRIDVCYLDTTYLNPKYAFPCQEDVITACAEICIRLNDDRTGHLDITKELGGGRLMSNFISDNSKLGGDSSETTSGTSQGSLLVVIGTYSIGKERICIGIAKALKSKIYAPAAKQRICGCLEDPELSDLLTSDPLKAQVHMQTIRDMRPETLSEYMNSLKPRFSRIVGFRPTGWNYRPPAGRMITNPPISTVLHSDSWKSRFSVKDLVPQRGSNKESSFFSVPYSEHSSFRELTMFCCALRISRVIPTVNVGSPKSREKMKVWVEKWEAEKRKAGLFKVDEGATRW